MGYENNFYLQSPRTFRILLISYLTIIKTFIILPKREKLFQIHSPVLNMKKGPLLCYCYCFYTSYSTLPNKMKLNQPVTQVFYLFCTGITSKVQVSSNHSVFHKHKLKKILNKCEMPQLFVDDQSHTKKCCFDNELFCFFRLRNYAGNQQQCFFTQTSSSQRKSNVENVWRWHFFV